MQERTLDSDTAIFDLVFAVDPDLAREGVSYDEAVDALTGYARRCMGSLQHIEIACGFEGSVDPEDVEASVNLKLRQLTAEVYALRLPRDGLPWQQIQAEDGEAVRQAMRSGMARFQRGRLHLVDPPSQKGFGIPFTLIGQMLCELGAMPAALDIPNLLEQVVFGDNGLPENAQQAVLSVVFRADQPISLNEIVNQTRMPKADVAHVLNVFRSDEVMVRLGGGWVMNDSYTSILSTLRRGGYSLSAGSAPGWVNVVEHGFHRGEWSQPRVMAESMTVGQRPGFDDVARALAVVSNMMVNWGAEETVVAINDGVRLPADASELPVR